ncbi:2-keto-3-deoxy-L-rhamnonate aldolase [Betaproteobacteria bacterium]|nr:2-keto-3-deoxy-L-rhamnonate aldolase [Betaproteobacteria bacterium]
MVQPNKLKEAIARSACIKGVHFTYYAPPALEIISNLEVDFIYIDGEHGLFDLHEVESMCILAEHYGMTPIARVRANTSDVITQYLDRGVKGIVVPHVDDTADARRAVEACFYRPLGERSFGGGRPYAHFFTNDFPRLLAECNAGVSLGLMIESTSGLENIDAIASTPGVDYLSFGMNDLAQSLGHAGNPRHPDVIAAVEAATARAHAVGKPIREDFMKLAWMNDIVLEGARKLLS